MTSAPTVTETAPATTAGGGLPAVVPARERVVGVAAGTGRRVADRWRRARESASTAGIATAARQAARAARTVRPLGWGLLGVVLASVWAGVALGWQELVVVAAAGVTVLLVAVAFVVGRSRYAVRLELADRRVVVGERAVGRVEVTSTATRHQLPAVVELPVGAGVAAFPLPRLAPGESHEDLFVVPTRRRAVVVVGPVRSVRGDALGLLRREVTWTEPVELFVHPRTVSLSGSSSGFLHDLEGHTTRDLSPSDVSFHALREYVPGDDRRHVHWRSSARTGTLMIRQYEETRRSHLAVALTLADADYADPDELELAVSVAGSLGLQALREEREVAIVTQTGTLRRSTGARLLDELTRVASAPRPDRLVDLAATVPVHVPHASVVVLVCGATVTATQLHAASARLPADCRRVAVRCVTGAPLARRALGNLPVLVLGELADLPRAMRSVVP